MNWKLIFLLSLFGLAMAIATVFVIPSTLEPVFWLLVFIVCAWTLARNVSGRYFLHGFVLSLANCVWVTAAHVLFFTTYMANHAEMVAMNAHMPLHSHPRILMLITGPAFGAVSGLVLGLFTWIASKMMKKK